MIRIRITASRSGYDHDGKAFSHAPGSEVEMEERDAMRLIAAEQAERVGPKDAERRGTWGLKISPEQYLERFPEGPNAAEAREAIG